METIESLDPLERFQNFFKDNYRAEIASMGDNSSKALTIDFNKLLAYDSALARSIVELPEEYLAYCDNALWTQLKIEDPEYAEEVKKPNVRFVNLPESSYVPIHSVGKDHVGKLVCLEGQIKKFTPEIQLFPITASFKCRKCGTIQYIKQEPLTSLKYPVECTEPTCGRRGSFDFIEKESVFVNFRKIGLYSRKAGIEAYLLDDLAEAEVKLGERIRVVGILKSKMNYRSNVFVSVMIANSLQRVGKSPYTVKPSIVSKIEIYIKQDYKNFENIIQSIHPLSNDPFFLPYKLLACASYCSSGAWDEERNTRRTINLLAVGILGWFKTSIMAQLQGIVGEELLGKGSGGVTTVGGLLPTVVVNKNEGVIEVQEGLLALYDRKCLWIDELNRCQHEEKQALANIEDGVYTMAKYGQYIPFEMKESFIGTQNWDKFRYDPSKTPIENLGLPENVLERFDVILEIKKPLLEVADQVAHRWVLQYEKSLKPAFSKEEIFAYLERVKQIYLEGKFKVPREILEEITQLWLQIYSVSENVENEEMNIRSMNVMQKLVEMLACMHFREVTWEDWEYFKEILIPVISQFLRSTSFQKAKIDLKMIALDVLRAKLQDKKEAEAEEVIEGIREALFTKGLDKDTVNKLMPSETTLDKNIQFRNLRNSLYEPCQRRGIWIISKPNIGTKFVKSDKYDEKSYIGEKNGIPISTYIRKSPKNYQNYQISEDPKIVQAIDWLRKHQKDGMVNKLEFSAFCIDELKEKPLYVYNRIKDMEIVFDPPDKPEYIGRFFVNIKKLGVSK